MLGIGVMALLSGPISQLLRRRRPDRQSSDRPLMRSKDPTLIARAEAAFAKREKALTEGALAMEEYRQRQEHQLQNIERLRRLRLERDQGVRSTARVRKQRSR
jgi:hypothetical protein